MACPAILTGERFLPTALRSVDCQAQTIGAYGYGALANPTSVTSIALTGLLTLFVALFGLRLMIGATVTRRDLFNDMLKIGIVLTLATSWPAWRTVGYDLIIHGPGEIARAIGLSAQLPGSGGDLANRLQRIDQGLSALIAYGTGRPLVVQGDWFHTQNDWFQFGLARIAFLSGTLGVTALVRLTAGILLAIAPLMAGLLLFGATRSIFAGWAKGLAMTFIASIAITLVIEVEVALLEPWLQDAIQKRAGQQLTLDAPIEGLVITLSFALVALAVIGVAAWIAFHASNWISIPAWTADQRASQMEIASPAVARSINGSAPALPPDRPAAQAIGESLRREARHVEMRSGTGNDAPSPPSPAGGAVPPPSSSGDTLGTSYRRSSLRVSTAGGRRDAS